ncbi:hypothetical protein ES288_D09G107100v1 [Gossypium darwinii]|uniref:Secreted protein n=2 Tax=Gossypium TaxID=3633 RepID=A0A5D2JHE4_GOSTO|nr:hypothetical protein ES288_D09G107100v1 [Gossypium darwinii]TYH53463.1 hypothetical protein ES332_D09G102100v1 [Gossypium tomentosum]
MIFRFGFLLCVCVCVCYKKEENRNKCRRLLSRKRPTASFLFSPLPACHASLCSTLSHPLGLGEGRDKTLYIIRVII